MENSDPFEIHNELLSDLITEYLDSAKKEERERNFTKWKLAFRNINDSPYHRACPILWDLYYLEDKKHIGIGKYDKLRSLLTEIGPAGDRINKAEKRIKAVTKDHGESKLDYPVIIEFKSRTKDPFYGDKVTMLAERLTTSDIEWCHVKESESTTRNLDLRLTNYSESTNEERISTLVISEARFEDSGLYYVSSKAGERLSNQLSLKVKGEIPDVFLRESTTCVSLGGTLELEGHVISTPPAKKISFWKLVDGKKGVIDISLEKYTGSTTDIKRTPVLRINKLNFRDEGSYWLRVENAVGRGESKHHEAKFNEDDTTRITRYFRLIHLGGEALKYILERKAKPSLRKYLEENTEEISFLCSRSQMDQLLKGVENLKEMDISVTYTLLRNMPNLDRPSKGWGSTPEDDNILPADDIERIRLHYEYIAQGDIPSLSPTSFTERWTELSKAIQRLNTNVLNPKIEDIKDLKLDKIAIGESLKALESNRKREFDLQFERKNIPIVEIQGLESVKYLKRAELTGNIQSPANISRIVWKKQNIEIDISEKKYSESHCNIGSTEAKLVIQRINIEDIGEYHLLVENESGRARSNILALKIKEKKPKCEILGKAHRTFILGETITLQGKVKSYPHSNVLKWRKEGITKSKKLNLDGEKYKGSNKDHQKPTLVINNIGIKDCGIYILHVENLKGEADSNEIKIDIEGGLPTAHIEGERKGEKFIFLGKVSSKPKALSIKWQRVVNNKAEDINISLPKYKGSSEDMPSVKLFIRHLTQCDTAKYRLVVRNAIGEGRSNQVPLHIESCSICSSIKANIDIQKEIKSGEKEKYLNIEVEILTEMFDIAAKTSNQEVVLEYLSDLQNSVSNVDVFECKTVDKLIGKTAKKIKDWRNIGDENTHREVLKRFLGIIKQVRKEYNITEWRCSRGSIIFDLEFAHRGSFLRFQNDMKDGEMKTRLSDIIVFEPLLEQLQFDLEKRDFSIFIEGMQEKRVSADIDLKPLTRSDVFAVAIDLGNTYSTYAFSDVSLSKTANIYSLTSNKYDVLEKIPTAILLNADCTFYLFGWKAKERYANLQGTEEAKDFHYFEHFITSIYETKAKSLDKNVSIPDSEGRAFDAKVILSRCATYMAERAMRHIREEFAYVQLSNFKFCFTLPTFWASTKDFLMDVLSVVPHGESQISIILESHAACLYHHLRLDDNTDSKLENSFQKLEKGDKYMIVDIGGETTDITVHSRSDFDGGIDEVLIPYTGPWGGNYVNTKMIDLLSEKYKLKRPIDMKTRQHLIDQFQFSIRKPGIDKISLNAPKIGREITVESAELDVLFEEPLQRIQQLLQKVFNTENVDVVIVMGGFSECKRVQIAVQEIFENKTVINPEEPGLAMLKGAVCHLQQLENKNLKSFTVMV